MFSAFVNLLIPTGPLFVLQVWDRVLTLRPEVTLVVPLDHARSRVLARAAPAAGTRP